jgi:hypothetical protein
MQRNPNLPSHVVSRAGGRRVASKGGKRKPSAAVTSAIAAAREAKLEKKNKKNKNKDKDTDNADDISPRACAGILGITLSVIGSLIYFSPATDPLESPEDAASAFVASCVYIADLLTPETLLALVAACVVAVGCVHGVRMAVARAHVATQKRAEETAELAKANEKERRRLAIQLKRDTLEAERMERLQRLETLRASNTATDRSRSRQHQQSNGGSGNDDHTTADVINTPWLQTQHLAFETALSNYTAAMYRNQSERWQAIAAAVPGKSAKECIAHFREIKQAILEQKTNTQQQPQDEDANQASWTAAGSSAFQHRAAYVPVASSDDEDDSSSSGSDDEEGDGDSEEHDLRLAVDVQSEPKLGSTKVCLEGMQLTNIGVAQVESLTLQVSCERCNKISDPALGGVYVRDSAVMWHCECGNSLRVQLTPAFLHANNEAVGYVECLHCSVQDVLACALRAQCLSCGSGLDDTHQSEDGTGPCVLYGVTRGRRAEGNCLSCHSKLAVGLRQFSVDVVGGDGDTGSSKSHTKGTAASAKGGKKTKNKGNSNGQMFKSGSPLPNQGACKHFSKSFRYLRFPCCGKAYACPVCHAAEGTCDEATWATRMICGKCSVEAAYANRACGACGFHMGVSGATKSGAKSAHWNGGGGTRSGQLLDKKDSRKHKGESKAGVKKTASKKKSRVGAAGKKARQQAKASSG